MARIAGVDLPNNKQARIALTYIFGIGDSARGEDPRKRGRRSVREDPGPGRGRAQPHPSGHRERRRDRRRPPQGRLAQHQAPDRNPVLPWPRHRRTLPVRGQRTHTNARTRKGPRKGTVAGKKKATKTKWQRHRTGGAGKAGKNKKFKKRERKNVPFGLVYIQASFNNTIVTITDQHGQHALLEELRLARLPRLPQGNPVRRAAGRVERRQRRRATTVCARSMCGSPGPAPAASPRSALSPPPASRSADPRRYADAAQRLPSAQAPPRLMHSAASALAVRSARR